MREWPPTAARLTDLNSCFNVPKHDDLQLWNPFHMDFLKILSPLQSSPGTTCFTMYCGITEQFLHAGKAAHKAWEAPTLPISFYNGLCEGRRGAMLDRHLQLSKKTMSDATFCVFAAQFWAPQEASFHSFEWVRLVECMSHICVLSQ